ncbi:unnamed protein product [Amoebophrya sp. A25]|nr:unnamed protein product [Amoebophrya sp. A25]|eukprot:GSA25T00020722001.1
MQQSSRSPPSSTPSALYDVALDQPGDEVGQSGTRQENAEVGEEESPATRPSVTTARAVDIANLADDEDSTVVQVGGQEGDDGSALTGGIGAIKSAGNLMSLAWLLRESVLSSAFAIVCALYLCGRSLIVSALYLNVSMFLLFLAQNNGMKGGKGQKTVCSFFLALLLLSIGLSGKISDVEQHHQDSASGPSGDSGSAPPTRGQLYYNYLVPHSVANYLSAISLHSTSTKGSSVIDRERAALGGEVAMAEMHHKDVVTSKYSHLRGKVQNVREEFKGLTVSIIIPAKYEKEYITKTLMYVYKITPWDLLEETIVVDDESGDPIDPLIENAVNAGELSFLSTEQRKSIRILRNNHRQGLIRAKIMGANAAIGTHIFFLDGHCRPFENWLEPLLHRSLGNYKRIVVPTIPDVEARDWSKKPNVGIKMMFEWNFHFDWFDDPGDEVPILSGGLLLMTKKWWNEMGGYDDGMLEWGGENIEQSLRCWMCGGEIVVERTSQVGHIFFRPQPPNKVKPLTVPRNKARAGYVWLDNYYKIFSEKVPEVASLDLGNNLLERLLFRYSYGCKKFDWWLHRFQSVFEQQGLIVDKQHHVRHSATGLCLEADLKESKVAMAVCQPENDLQRWGWINGRKRLVNAKAKKCLDRGNNAGFATPILYACDRTMSNMNQIWSFTNDRDPPSQKDRNFQDDHTFAGLIFSNGQQDGSHSDKLGLAHLRSSIGGKCIGSPWSHENKVGMYDCGQEAVSNPNFQFDIIW